MDNNNGFKYTYSAREQEELKKIREKYNLNREEDKMERLRRLDASVTNKAQSISLVLGIIGALVLGCGMSLIMTELSTTLGMERDVALFFGVIVGVLGGGLVSLAYPVYNFVVKRERKKVAPEIIRLTDELMK